MVDWLVSKSYQHLAHDQQSGTGLRQCYGSQQAAQHFRSTIKLAGTHRWQADLQSADSSAGPGEIYWQPVHRDRE